MYNGIFNNTDDIFIFNNYSSEKLNMISNILSVNMNNISEVKDIFNKFIIKIFDLDPVDNIVFPNDNNISLKSYRIYFHRMVRFVIDKHTTSDAFDQNKNEFYKNVVNMPAIFLEYLRDYIK